ncbi:Nuclear RNA export factor 2 [Strongyloides ratti]|uniref:Nuclear RNA export factor 2 n=1 Tax=Strongyloides ratti TaxID=34506 RepID=A0A090L1M6_STRRB|nr:Nuclear RNA export factor 2 [Strongyloides ratti]CEF62022.1 Nuclear RNA export factor 2 [Strongyloides ratti]
MAKKLDVKTRSINCFAHFDPDILSSYNNNDNNSLRPNKFENHFFTTAGDISTKEIMFSVLIKGCSQCTLDEIITVIQGYTPPFIPYLIGKINNDDIKFYVKDIVISTNLQQLSRRVKNPKTKTNLLIITSKTVCSWNKLSFDSKKVIELACRNRLSDDKKTLDLSNFGSDSCFKDKYTTISLERPEIMIVIIDFAYEFCPEVTNLSLKGTELRNLNLVASLAYAIPLVKVLDLSCNKINQYSELAKIRIWKLEKLFLTNDDVLNTFINSSEYVRIIQGYFPYLTSLDNMYLSFSENNLSYKYENNIPVQPGYIPSSKIQTLLEIFIMQYFDLFDGPDGMKSRKLLEKFYDENSIFSINCDVINDGNYDKITESKKKLSEPEYKIYRSISHNILHQDKWYKNREHKYAKNSLEVLTMLCRLPLTQHNRDIFLVDVFYATSEFVGFTIQGLLNDGEACFVYPKPKNNLKYFTRSFFCLLKNETEVSIISDILNIYPISQEHISKYQEYFMKLKKQQTFTEMSTAVNDLLTSMTNTSTSSVNILSP